MKLRLHGTAEEVTEATRQLLEVLDVVSVSNAYPDRGASVLIRVYLEIRLPQANQPEAGRRPGPTRPARRSPGSLG